MDRLEIKAMAKEQIKGKIGILLIITLITAVISLAATYVGNLIPVVGSLIPAVISPALTLSLTLVYLKVCSGIAVRSGDAFEGFYNLWAAFKVEFLMGLFTLLWSLLLVIPGIIKGFSYSMAMYVLAENPDMPALKAIKRSQKIMDGRKMDLFVLVLSFIGWGALVAITFGIAAIWVVPYMSATITNFYNSAKNINNETI